MSDALPRASSPAPAASHASRQVSDPLSGQSSGQPPVQPPAPKKASDAVACERCGTEMFRMHAVWRCPSCGFKTDCCGW